MKRWRSTMARVAVVTAAVASSACMSEPPEVGELGAIYAPPAEEVTIQAIARNQTFGDVLTPVMSANDQAALLMAFREHWSPRRMSPGTEVTFRYLADDGSLRGVDVEVSADHTVRLDRGDFGWESQLIETPTYVDTIFTSGEVESTLWDAVVYNPDLSSLRVADRNSLLDALDKVFQWQIDFFRQPRVEDTYRFAFEREVRPDGSMRSGRLLAAEYVNASRPYHAIYFHPEGDEQGSYFDMDGESVRRAFLLKPLEYRRISGRYVESRLHPVLGTWRAHRGIDYAANAGTPVMTTSDGVVIHRGWKGSFGNTVEVRAPNGYVTRYAHLRSFQADVQLGSRVTQSDVIGYVGMSGLATGPHLHYEMLKQNGQHTDPLGLGDEEAAGDPVPSGDRDRWEFESTVRFTLLESIPPAGPVRMSIAEAEDTQAPQPQDDDSGGAG